MPRYRVEIRDERTDVYLIDVEEELGVDDVSDLVTGMTDDELAPYHVDMIDTQHYVDAVIEEGEDPE